MLFAEFCPCPMHSAITKGLINRPVVNRAETVRVTAVPGRFASIFLWSVPGTKFVFALMPSVVS